MDTQFYIRIRGNTLGPYDEEKLQSLVRRGQLSRMHEISPDGVKWVLASTYPDLFTSAAGSAPTLQFRAEVQAGAAPAASAHPSPEEGFGGSISPPVAGTGRWYYERGGRSLGPFDASRMTQMLTSGELGPDDMVWSEGMPAWVPARHAPGLLAERPSVWPDGGPARDSTPPKDTLPASLCRSAVTSRGWVLFLAVMAFIVGGLYAIGGTLLLIGGANAHIPPVVASGLFSLIYAMLAMAGGWLLSGYASRLGALRYTQRPVVLERALDVLRSFWIYVSMVTIIFLALALIVAIWVVSIMGSIPSWL